MMAVLLNIVFNIVGRPKDDEAPIFAEGPAIAAISDSDELRLAGHQAADETAPRRSAENRDDIDLPAPPQDRPAAARPPEGVEDPPSGLCRGLRALEIRSRSAAAATKASSPGSRRA